MTMIRLALLLALSLPAQAANWADVRIKSATYALTKQVKSATGTVSTVTISRHASFDKAIEAAKLQPPGSYRIVLPSVYVEIRACSTAGATCLDLTDSRVIP